MKTYSPEEKAAARETLPPPLREFLDSADVAHIFASLGKDSRLNIRQADVAFQLVEATFLGLEPEAMFEVNLKNALPELDTDVLQNLLSSINERIFTEAKRRLLASQKESGE